MMSAALTGSAQDTCRNLVVLGSTGSVGTQALDVAARFPDRVRVVALAANTSVELLAEQARRFGVRQIVVGTPEARDALMRSALPAGTVVATGLAAIEELAALDGADVVLNALVGARGLRASRSALAAGKRLALANKESLVVGGDVLMPLAVSDGSLVPVDSEHSALFQCLAGEAPAEVARLWLTASGGPFRGASRAELATATPKGALSHPTWRMGRKISIDSATLANKGLEVIEAHHLFGLAYDCINVVVHPQSCVHSMAAFVDGSVKAHLGVTDMRIPIQYALSYPGRWEAPLAPLDFTQLGSLDFEPADQDAFGCLTCAYAAGRTGKTAPCVLNAANEVAVEAFLEGRCGFLDIEGTIAAVLSRHDAEPVEGVEHLEAVDAWARAEANAHIDAVASL
ncbi:MAG: 1-deoxy-D-xylulose-5-phosphate reductoisomerase [Coriobacteriales bacterium]|jgi:1-deoxy-D-xylulose-5-phosphate reductoisomerase|nr:1-deoxy-D-xylulose-5-phosphate reductoisomerase [Coriobacteriales bacterium]